MALGFMKRRRYIVESFQYRLLAFNLLHSLSVLFIVAAIMFVPLIIKLNNHALPLSEKEVLAAEFLALHVRLWPAIFIAFFFLAFHSIYVSNKIAGPLYRLRRIYKSIGEGNLHIRVAFRRKDYLTKDAGRINEMITALASGVERVKEDYVTAHEVLRRLRTAGDGDSLESVNACIAELEGQMERLRTDLDYFKLAPGQPPSNGNGSSIPATSGADGSHEKYQVSDGVQQSNQK